MIILKDTGTKVRNFQLDHAHLNAHTAMAYYGNEWVPQSTPPFRSLRFVFRVLRISYLRIRTVPLTLSSQGRVARPLGDIHYLIGQRIPRRPSPLVYDWQGEARRLFPLK